MLRQFELVERVKSYDPNADEEGLNRAYVFAVKMHGSQKRESGDPYFSHPVEVAGILTEYKLDYATIVTALLHDTVEDTDVTVEQIREEFGDRVADLVASESDTFEEGVSEEESWHARKQAAIDRLSKAGREAKMVALGDKLSNMRAIARDYAVQGDALWNLFHAKDPKDHEWHYRGLADALRDLEDTFAYKEFENLINQIFA